MYNDALPKRMAFSEVNDSDYSMSPYNGVIIPISEWLGKVLGNDPCSVNLQLFMLTKC